LTLLVPLTGSLVALEPLAHGHEAQLWEAAQDSDWSLMPIDAGASESEFRRWLGVELDAAEAASDLQMRFQHVSAESPEASLDRWKRELDPDVAERFARELGSELRAVGLDA